MSDEFTNKVEVDINAQGYSGETEPQDEKAKESQKAMNYYKNIRYGVADGHGLGGAEEEKMKKEADAAMNEAFGGMPGADKKAAKEKDRKEREKQEKKANQNSSGAKKPKIFDRGIVPAIGFALGTAVGAVLGYTVVILPFLLGAIFSGAAKGISYAVKKAAYNKQVNEEAKKVGEKKAEQKEKEDSKKSEKELEKSKELEKEKVKAPEVKNKEVKENKVQNNKGKAQEYTQGQKEFFEWCDKTRELELTDLNREHKNVDFEKQKAYFSKHLVKLTALKQMEVSEKKQAGSISNGDYKQNFEESMKAYSEGPAVKKMVDSIKKPEDISRLRELANKDNGAGLINELSKHDKKAVEEKSVQDKHKEKQLKKQPEEMQMNQPGLH